jgi:tetratricopeptide (TPR) repeat protein
VSRSLLLAVALACVAVAAAAAQSRSARLLSTAQAHIASQQWDSADVALSDALDTAPYIMDSCWAYLWRGVLEYERGHYRLARMSFRRALALYPDPGIRLDTISPALANLFDVEFRANRTFQKWDLDQPARWVSVPPLAYPRELRARRISGSAIVRMIVDTLGHVPENSIEMVEIPDTAFVGSVTRMMSAATFIPARLGGKPVRSLVAYRVSLTPPVQDDPIRLIDQARKLVRSGQPDSALAILQDALDPVNGATPAVRVYAELVRGTACQKKHDSARAAGSFQLGLGQYHALRAQGVDFAPFLRSFADSVRLVGSLRAAAASRK